MVSWLTIFTKKVVCMYIPQKHLENIPKLLKPGKAPSAWSINYPNSKFTHITKENYLGFI